MIKTSKIGKTLFILTLILIIGVSYAKQSIKKTKKHEGERGFYYYDQYQSTNINKITNYNIYKLRNIKELSQEISNQREIFLTEPTYENYKKLVELNQELVKWQILMITYAKKYTKEKLNELEPLIYFNPVEQKKDELYIFAFISTNQLDVNNLRIFDFLEYNITKAYNLTYYIVFTIKIPNEKIEEILPPLIKENARRIILDNKGAFATAVSESIKVPSAYIVNRDGYFDKLPIENRNSQDCFLAIKDFVIATYKEFSEIFSLPDDLKNTKQMNLKKAIDVLNSE